MPPSQTMVVERLRLARLARLARPAKSSADCSDSPNYASKNFVQKSWAMSVQRRLNALERSARSCCHANSGAANREGVILTEPFRASVSLVLQVVLL